MIMMNTPMTTLIDNNASTQSTINGSFTTDTHADNELPTGNLEFNVELFFIVFKLTVGLIGIVGNAAVCYVLYKMPPGKVKFLIICQSVIDLATAVIIIAGNLTNRIPQLELPVPKRLFFAYFYCLFWHAEIIFFGLTAVSSYNLAAIAIERYLAVLHPMWYHVNFTKTKQLLLGGSLWVIAPFAQITWTITARRYDGQGECVRRPRTELSKRAVGIYIFIGDFFIPCCIMAYCFSRVCLSLIKQDKQAKVLKGHTGGQKGSQGNHDQKGQVSDDTMARSRRVTKMFLFVFLAYLLCWSLNQFLFLQYNLGGMLFFRTPVGYLANTLSLLNIICNPFIYVFNNKEYRDILKCRGPK